MIPIKDLSIPGYGIANGIIVEVSKYVLGKSDVTVIWRLVKNNIPVVILGKGPYTGTMLIPPTVVELWGTNDNIIIDYVLTQLGTDRLNKE